MCILVTRTQFGRLTAVGPHCQDPPGISDSMLLWFGLVWPVPLFLLVCGHQWASPSCSDRRPAWGFGLLAPWWLWLSLTFSCWFDLENVPVHSFLEQQLGFQPLSASDSLLAENSLEPGQVSRRCWPLADLGYLTSSFTMTSAPAWHPISSRHFNIASETENMDRGTSARCWLTGLFTVQLPWTWDTCHFSEGFFNALSDSVYVCSFLIWVTFPGLLSHLFWYLLTFIFNQFDHWLFSALTPVTWLFVSNFL